MRRHAERPVRCSERWLWLGETLPPADAGVRIWRAFPGCFFLAVATGVSGPYDDETILRALRMACTPTIDGCEKGPHRLGIAAFDDLRAKRRGPTWQELAEADLPHSITRYEISALEPVSGCCTTDGSVPEVDWTFAEGALDFVSGERGRHRGRLLRGWNAHPKGALVLSDERSLQGGFAIIDVALSCS